MRTVLSHVNLFLLTLVVLGSTCSDDDVDDVLDVEIPGATVTISPDNTCVEPGETVDFTVMVSSGTPPFPGMPWSAPSP